MAATRTLKLLLIGDSGVGKSCLLLRYCDDRYQPNMLATMGIDFRVKDVVVDQRRPAKLQIWDTAGQERYRTITQSYFRGAEGVVFVYDVADRASFNNIINWVRDIEMRSGRPLERVLVANKCDLRGDESKAPGDLVSVREGQELAERYQMPFLEASARDNTNVDMIFELLATGIMSTPPPMASETSTTRGSDLLCDSGLGNAYAAATAANCKC